MIQHPEEMNRETLYDLRALLALYPYYQTARLLMLQNLYLLHDPSFDEELRRAAIYISDRKVIFQMVEAAHYQLKSQNSNRHEAMEGKPKSDRTSSLIDHFLHSIPTEAEEREKEPEEKRKPTPADAAVDYVAYLMETETETEHEQPSRTITLIDDFIEEGGFKLHKDKEAEEDQESEVMEKKEEKEEETSTEQQLQEVREKIAVSASARRVRRRWISVARSGRSARSWRRSASAVCWDWTSRLSRASASRCSVWRAWD